MERKVNVTVTGAQPSDDIRRRCRTTIEPFIDSQTPADVVTSFEPEGSLSVKIVAEAGVNLGRHHSLIARSIMEELEAVLPRSEPQPDMGRSTQFTYVPGETESMIAAAIEP